MCGEKEGGTQGASNPVNVAPVCARACASACVLQRSSGRGQVVEQQRYTVPVCFVCMCVCCRGKWARAGGRAAEI